MSRSSPFGKIKPIQQKSSSQHADKALSRTGFLQSIREYFWSQWKIAIWAEEKVLFVLKTGLETSFKRKAALCIRPEDLEPRLTLQ
jgi:hypothetical protein